jgi:hypothetical protein
MNLVFERQEIDPIIVDALNIVRLVGGEHRHDAFPVAAGRRIPVDLDPEVVQRLFLRRRDGVLKNLLIGQGPGRHETDLPDVLGSGRVRPLENRRRGACGRGRRGVYCGSSKRRRPGCHCRIAHKATS